jgi:hypothetical protein
MTDQPLDDTRLSDDEKREMLDYIAHMSLELAAMAEKIEADDLSQALRMASIRALDHMKSGIQART